MPSVSHAECHLCWVSFMLSVTNKPFMLSVVMLIVIVLSAVLPSALLPLAMLAPYIKLSLLVLKVCNDYRKEATVNRVLDGSMYPGVGKTTLLLSAHFCRIFIAIKQKNSGK
jgi:hypothetical protein